MGKVKGGLGESSLIKDLTKPISFHISEALEPPPVFDRRMRGKGPVLEAEEKSLPRIILKKTAALAGGDDIQIVFHLEGCKDSLLIKNGAAISDWLVLSVRGKEGEYLEVPWKDSIFSTFDVNKVIERQADRICLVEVVTEEDFINFSSIDDFYEWLEI